MNLTFDFNFSQICQIGNTALISPDILGTSKENNVPSSNNQTKKNKEKPMIISDLNHVEIVSESAQVEGGFNSYQSGLTIYSDQYIKDNNAIAGAKSDAYGPNTFSKTQTKTTTVAGAYSGSESLSVAGSSRDYYRY